MLTKLFDLPKAGSVIIKFFILLLPFSVQAQENVKMMLDFIPTGDYSPYYAAIDNGIYEKHNIKLSITRGNGSGDTILKVASGVADIGIADISAVITSRIRNNTPVKSVATIFTHSPHSLFVLKDSGIENFTGLEGKKIAISPGNSHKLYFPFVAEQANTDSSKIEWVTVDGSAMASLLISGKVDAAPFFTSNWYYQNKQAQKYGKEIVVLPFSEQGFNIYSMTFVASESTIEERPELIKNFLTATLEAWHYAKDNPEEACAAHVKANPEVDMDDCQGNLAAIFKYIFNDYSDENKLGHFNDERLLTTFETVAQVQDLPTDWDVYQAIEPSFIKTVNP